MTDVRGSVKRIVNACTSVGVFVATLLVLSPVASAGAQTVQGQATCINDEHPVGVWVQGDSSKSGWADIHMPVELGGLSKVDFSYILNNGGQYQVHVGCGGTPQNWKLDLKSDYVSGDHNFICDDINPMSLDAWKIIASEVVGLFGKADLTKGVPYGRCNPV